MLRNLSKEYPNNEKIELHTVIQRLKSNDSQWEELRIGNILINPKTVHTGCGYSYVVSIFTDDALIELAEAVKMNKTIQKMTFTGLGCSTISMECTEQGISAIAEAFKDHPMLESIYVDFLHCKDQAIYFQFFNCLFGTANIKNFMCRIKLENNELMDQFSMALSQKNCLEYIFIEGNIKSEYRYSEATLLALANSLSRQRNLKELKLSYLNLNDEGILHISNALVENKIRSIQSLTLNKCDITDDGMKWINRILRMQHHVVKLNLSGNKFGVTGVTELTSILLLLKNLQELSLSDVELGAELLKILVSAWLGDSQFSITKFDMSSNPFNNDSAAFLIELIQKSMTLKSLIVNFCDITNEHIHEMAAILSNPNQCRLEYFYMGGNQLINKEICHTLITAVKMNENILGLYPPGGSSKELRHALACNGHNKLARYLASQQKFVNAAIELGNLFYSLPDENNKEMPHVSILPIEIILSIIMHCGERTLGMDERNIHNCASLVLNNFSKRRKLINDGEYNPTNANDLKKWWSQSQGEAPNHFTIFRHVSRKIKIDDCILDKEPQQKKPTPARRQQRCNLM